MNGEQGAPRDQRTGSKGIDDQMCATLMMVNTVALWFEFNSFEKLEE